MVMAAEKTLVGVVNSTGSMPAPTICQSVSTTASEAARIAMVWSCLARRRCAATCWARARSSVSSGRPASAGLSASTVMSGHLGGALRSRGVELAPDMGAQLGEARIGAHRLDVARAAERHIDHLLDAARARRHHGDA